MTEDELSGWLDEVGSQHTHKLIQRQIVLIHLER